jgi:prepilin-type N-terminal cleavage/methylation domain-containing protein/prepilin-type processing-associated H-X9-DG protein
MQMRNRRDVSLANRSLEFGGRLTRGGFTLIELLVVVAIIALLISILLPSLNRAREQTRSLVCMSNLRSLAQAVITYDTENGRLPRAHPAVYRNASRDALIADGFSADRADYQKNRYISYSLRPHMNVGTDGRDTAADKVSTCPVSSRINPDDSFVASRSTMGTGLFPSPMDYCINNWALNASETDGGPSDGPRGTDPPSYFGQYPNDPTSPDFEKFPSRSISVIPKSSEEWMIADAWYRAIPQGFSDAFKQEGPYQSNWTGRALPNFAPHYGPERRYTYDQNQRSSDSETYRENKSDGRTNTVFFDGHSEPVDSKAFIVPSVGYDASNPLLYGFPGTVNPKVNDSDSVGKRLLTQGFWK